MRLTAFALVTLVPALAFATDLQPSGSAPDSAAMTLAQGPQMPDAGKIGAAMGGDALPCGQATAINNADVSEGLRGNALSDADLYADKLSELPAKATETVKNLSRTYPVREDLIRHNYFVAVCERLKEKSVGLETLKPALASLAQALGLPEPAAAENVPNQPAPAPDQAAAATSATPSMSAVPGDDKAAAVPEPSATTAEPKVAEALPTAPAETPLPNAPTDIQPPSTPAEGAAPAPVARVKTMDQLSPDTKVEQAPAGVPQDPAAAALKAESTGQPVGQSAPQPSDQVVAQGGPQPGAPGTEQPAAPEASTMAPGDAPADSGQPNPHSGPDPMQSSPGSVEQPAVANTPAQPQSAPAASVAPALAEAPGTAAPATQGTEQPAAPESSTMVQGNAPTDSGQPNSPSGADSMQSSPGSVEQPGVANTPAQPQSAPSASAPPAVAETPAAPPATEGTEQPAAPEASTIARGDAPTDSGQPNSHSGPEPMQSSPGSVEQPAVADTPAPQPAASAGAPPAVAEAPAVSQPSVAPQTPAAETPAAPLSAPVPTEAPAADAPSPTPAPTETAQAPASDAPPPVPTPAETAQAPAPSASPPVAIPAETAQAPTPSASPPVVTPAETAQAPTPDALPSAPTAQASTPAPEAPPAIVQAPAATPTPNAPPAPDLAAAPAAAPQARTASQLATGTGLLGEEECRALGVLSNCPDLNSVLAQLFEKPLEYNKPKTMYLGRMSELGLVLRTDWKGKDLPAEISEQMKNFPDEVQQGLTKITRVMSAELSGQGFEIAPSGRQERTVVMPQPVSWAWQVKPTDSGAARPLKLQLYAHIEGPSGAMPPILVKTLDATIDVDVKMWDRVLAQLRGVQPFYAVLAVLLGLLTAVLTYMFARKPAKVGPSGSSRRRRPVIGDLDQSGRSGRTPPRRDEP